MDHSGDEEEVVPHPMEQVDQEELLNNTPAIPPLSAPEAPQQLPTAASRLAIKSLILENFKSYAGQQVIGPFHRSFSAVVGPNGSGKSNVMDGILFVFGKQAKKLRLNKVSELIHKSEQHTDLKSAKVTGEAGDEEWKVVPDSEFSIARKARINNTSEYYLNGQKAKRDEVVDLLKGRGVDLDNNRFLILQGEVEQISMMKPKARNEHEVGVLEYLEDIIGTNVFVQPIEEAFTALERLSEDRLAKLQRAKFVQSELTALEPAKQEAEEYLFAERDVLDKQSLVFAAQKLNAMRAIAKHSTRKSTLESNLAEHREEMNAFMQGQADLESRFKTGQAEVDKITKKLEKSKAKYSLLEKEDAQFREQIKHLKAKLKRVQLSLQKNSKQQESKGEELEKVKISLDAARQSLTDQRAPLEQEEGKLDDMQNSLKDELAPIHKQLEKKQMELMPFQKAIDSAQAELQVAQNELQIYTKKGTTANAKLAAVREEIASITTLLPSNEELLKSKMTELQRLETRKNDIGAELETLQQQEAELVKHAARLRGAAEEVKTIHQQVQSTNQALNGLMALKQAGKINGVYGRLGDLGTMSDLMKYDVAVSTAGGARFDNIVVDTTDTATKAVSYLREKNLGRATFIILDKIQHLQGGANQKPQLRPDVARLYDMIEVEDQKLKLAFYFALGDTLVAPDMKTALEVGLDRQKRWRVVTLDGKIIETSGTLSGGGQAKRGALAKTIISKQRKGGSARSGSSADVESKQAEALAQEKEAELQALKDKIRALDVELDKITSSIESLRRDIPKIELDLKQLKKKLAELEKRLPSLLAEAETNNKADEELARLEDAEKINHAIGKLQQDIENAGGSPIQKQRSKVGSLQELYEKSKAEVSKQEAALKSLERACQKLSKTIESETIEIEQIKKNREELDQNLVALVEQATKVVEEQEALMRILKDKGSIQEELKAEYMKAKQEQARLRTIEVEIQNQLEDVVKQLKDVTGMCRDLEGKLESLARQKKSLGLDFLLAPLPQNPEIEDSAKRARPESIQADGEDAMDIDNVPARSSREETVDRSLIDLPQLSEDELDSLKIHQIIAEVDELRDKLSQMKPNTAAIQDYRDKAKNYEDVLHDLDVTTALCEQQRQQYDNLRRQRLELFQNGFLHIRKKLSEMYKTITLDDGDADLEPIDSMDPFSEGISFRVRPPKKSWKFIHNLSGGEKTLSSLALVFALHSYKPNPIYIMDEIDAALDFKNVSIVANYIKERTKDAQFLVISLRNYMFELADRLVGIYKTSNQTKSVAIDPRKFKVPLKVVASNITLGSSPS